MSGWGVLQRPGTTPRDTAAMLAALFAISVADFVTGPLLILLFGSKPPLVAHRRLGRAGTRHSAGAHTCRALHRLYRADHAHQHARGARAGFRPHRARQRPRRNAGSFTNTRSRSRSCRWFPFSARWLPISSPARLSWRRFSTSRAPGSFFVNSSFKQRHVPALRGDNCLLRALGRAESGGGRRLYLSRPEDQAV